MLPLEVDSGYVEDDSFQPQDHEESLREWTVSDALPVTSRLQTHIRTQTNADKETNKYNSE